MTLVGALALRAQPSEPVTRDRAPVAERAASPALEHVLRERQLQAIHSAPAASVAPPAFAAAVAQRQRMAAPGPRSAAAACSWRHYGRGPLIANAPEYVAANGYGWVELAGRIDSLAYDPRHARFFAASGTGGIWMSRDRGATWRSIGESLPSQVVGAVAWTRAHGGSVLALSGDPTFAPDGYTGIGAFYSTDLGRTWRKRRAFPTGRSGSRSRSTGAIRASSTPAPCSDCSARATVARAT